MARTINTAHKIRRGESAVTSTSEVATGLSTVVSAVVCLKDDIALTGNAVSVAGSAIAGNILIKVWKPTTNLDCTPIAATTAKTIRWIAIGT